MKNFYTVTNAQLFLTALLISIISSALIIINTHVSEYLQLPLVNQAADGRCLSVESYHNGEAFTCTDVGTVLRSYRVKRVK